MAENGVKTEEKAPNGVAANGESAPGFSGLMFRVWSWYIQAAQSWACLVVVILEKLERLSRTDIDACPLFRRPFELQINAGEKKEGKDDAPATAAPAPGTGKAVDFAKISIEEAFTTLKVPLDAAPHTAIPEPTSVATILAAPCHEHPSLAQTCALAGQLRLHQ